MMADVLKLYNGFDFPALGLGTWQSKRGEVENAVKVAIECGYRHIDCAAAYSNEKEVGNALKEKIDGKVIERKDLFVTSKLWNTRHAPEDVEVALRQTLSDLQLSYLDLYLIHWPIAYRSGNNKFPKNPNGSMIFIDVPLKDTWAAMEKCVEKGLVRSIGLSNFNSKQIAEICSSCTIQPAVLQIECHPYLNQKRLIEFCASRKIAITCYSPLGSTQRPWAKSSDPKLLQDRVLEEIATKYGKSAAQVAIRFQLERNLSVIPKSVNPERIKQNFDVYDFALTDEDMEKIMALDIPWRACFPTITVNGKEAPRDGDNPNFPFSEPF